MNNFSHAYNPGRGRDVEEYVASPVGICGAQEIEKAEEVQHLVQNLLLLQRSCQPWSYLQKYP